MSRLKLHHRLLNALGLVLFGLGTLLSSGRTRRARSVCFGLIRKGKRRFVGTAGCTSKARGVLHSAGLYQRMNLEYDVLELDEEYRRKSGFSGDLKLLLKWMWVYLLYSTKRSGKGSLNSDYFNLFGVYVNNSTTEVIMKTLSGMLESHPLTRFQVIRELQSLDEMGTEEYPAPQHICFVNANNFNLALERKEYLRALRKADLVLPDGIGVKLALQSVGGRLRKNLNGTDLFPHLAELFLRNGMPLFLLGATDAILAKAEENIIRKYPGLRVAGKRSGYFKPEDEEALCQQINNSGAYAVILGMGTPRQELWVDRNLHRLKVPILFSMGGLLDFLGEKNKRAPLWMRQTGLEWVYRLLQEPGRMWKRYIIGNPLFLYRVHLWKKGKLVLPGITSKRKALT